MIRKKTIVFCLFITFLIPSICFPKNQQEAIHIAFVSDGPSESLSLMQLVFEKEIINLLSPELSVSIEKKPAFSGDWSYDSIQAAIDNAFNDPSIDYVVALGFFSSQAISSRKELPKPCFCPLILNQELERAPLLDDTSGKKNLSYVTFPKNWKDEIETFKKMLSFETLGVLYDPLLKDFLPHFQEDTKKLLSPMDIQIKFIPYSYKVKDTLERIDSSLDAVMLIPFFHISSQQLSQLSAGLIEKKMPSFTLFEKSYVDAGILALLSPDATISQVARRVSLNIQRVVMGEKPSTLPVFFHDTFQLSLNLTTAYKIQASIPWNYLVDARLVDRMPKTGRELSFLDAVGEAITANRSLLAAARDVTAGKQQVNQALSELLPQVNLGAEARVIDDSTAKYSYGWEPKRIVDGGLKGKQIIYSNEKIGNFQIEQKLQDARKSQYKRVFLDTVLDASESYINILRFQTLELIQDNNLNLTRSFLEIAKHNVSVGMSRLDEVYRWESEIASVQAGVVRTKFRTKTGKNILNRILHRPIEEEVHVEELSLNDPMWLTTGSWFNQHVHTESSLEKFQDLSVIEGLELSPELRQINQEIEAHQKALGITKRSFYLPELSAFGETKNRFYRGGTGADFPLFKKDDLSWKAGIELSFPLVTGGNKLATNRKAHEQLEGLYCQREALIDKLAETIRSAINAAASSFIRISLTRKASEAAHKSLALIKDSYTKGSVSILSLLDSQTQALVADLQDANAVYDYLIDLLFAQRAIGRYDFLLTEEEREEWLDKINSILYESNVGLKQ